MALHLPILHRLDAINHWRLFRYALPLKVGGTRCGLLLCIDDQWGEIAPLPGRSSETLGQAEQQIITLLSHAQIPTRLYPSVAFGFESACRGLPRITFPLCALLTGSVEEILKEAERKARQGFHTAKIKISQLSSAEAIDLLHTLKSVFRLRVDANRCFSFVQAMRFFSSFDEDAFDFIEEPIHEIDRLADFSHPFALDETLVDTPSFPITPQLKALVLKPTLLGGITTCTSFVARAQDRQLIFSSAYESGLGLLQIVSLAHAMGAEMQPLGLDTYSLFQRNLLMLDFSKPVSTIPPISIDFTQLQEVAHG